MTHKKQAGLFSWLTNERSKQHTTTAEKEVTATSDALERDEPASLASHNHTAGLAPTVGKVKLFGRLKQSLLKTKQQLGDSFFALFKGHAIDHDLLEQLEEHLLIADVGINTTTKIMHQLTQTVKKQLLKTPQALYLQLRRVLVDILQRVEVPWKLNTSHTPTVILIVGVNGVGKTTTIGKLAHHFRKAGQSVMLAAGDTFRAAAVEQLQIWGQRNHIPVIAQSQGADAAAVIFDALQAARTRHIDIVIADTAGRLHNKSDLMAGLQKIARVIKKFDPQVPFESLLVIDASTGQNAISQTQLFHQALEITGLIITKLDGTAKGGVVFALADRFNIPIRYLATGEQLDDLRSFDAEAFVDALLEPPQQ